MGERCRLTELETTGEAMVSRLTPLFVAPAAPGPGVPLMDRSVSRKPLRLRSVADELLLSSEALDVRVDGHHITQQAHRISGERLVHGLVIELGHQVTLLLHRLASPRPPTPRHGLLGDSDAIEELRRQITQVSDLDVPVLLRGESGTGKELVARALHEASPRRSGPMVMVNMAAVSSSTAVSQLFGHARGAFTGASAEHRGYFQAADGGTLFLDEVGDMPLEVQVMLLRALESGEVQPLGASRAVRADVRVIAATDVDLEGAVARGTFRPALLHRLSGYMISVPPLRARRDDIARLLYHFLQEELSKIGQLQRLEHPAERPWIGAEVVASLMRYSWPGNVRELRNVARQLVIASRGGDRAGLDAEVTRLLDESERHAHGALTGDGAARRGLAQRSEPEPDQIRAALSRNGHRMAAAAAELGVSRTRLYALVERLDDVRTGADLQQEDIAHAMAATDGDLERAAVALRVSRRALVLRIRALGLGENKC